MRWRVAMFILAFLVLPLAHVRAEETSPESKLRCWTKEACTADLDKNGKADGRWDNGTTEAKKECGDGVYGYCYAQPEPLDLNVAVPLPNGVIKTSVTDFGDYINTFYNYLIGVSAIIAVVMIMVSGAQYVAAAGSGEVGKAKERIRKAVTGFVLLLFAVLLLETVNPQLRKLEVPPIPKIRQVVVYAEDTTCEWFLNLTGPNDKNASYTLRDPASGKEWTDQNTSLTPGEIWCGVYEDYEVIKDPQGNELTDVTCKWTWCGGDFVQHEASGIPFPKVCTEISGRSVCVACQEGTTGPPFPTVTPSADTCARLTPSDTDLGEMYYGECLFSRDDGFTQSQIYDSRLRGQCAALAFDCSKIKECDDYESVIVENEDGKEYLEDLNDPIQFTIGSDKLQEICEQNQCKKQIGTDCVYKETILVTECKPK